MMEFDYVTETVAGVTTHYAVLPGTTIRLGEIVESKFNKKCGWGLLLPRHPRIHAGMAKGLRLAKAELEEEIIQWFKDIGAET